MSVDAIRISGHLGAASQRQQLTEEVAAYVRELIMSGAVRPGEFLRMERIAEAVGVSNTPDRNAAGLGGQSTAARLLLDDRRLGGGRTRRAPADRRGATQEERDEDPKTAGTRICPRCRSTCRDARKARSLERDPVKAVAVI